MDEGKVSASGRGNYEVTRSGIEWGLENASRFECCARLYRRDSRVGQSGQRSAGRRLNPGRRSRGIHEKRLSRRKKVLAATGTVIADAKKDEDVGVARLNGIIDHKEGKIHVCKVPRIQHGGSRKINRNKLLAVINGAGVIAAVGLEAFIALKAAGKKTGHVLWSPGRSH